MLDEVGGVLDGEVLDDEVLAGTFPSIWEFSVSTLLVTTPEWPDDKRSDFATGPRVSSGTFPSIWEFSASSKL